MSGCTGLVEAPERRVDAGHQTATSLPAEQSTCRDLRSMTRDGIFFSVMVGIGETYLPAFVLAAGLGEVAAGLITTLPLLAGAVLQLLAPRGVQWLGSTRLWVVGSAALQALCFVPLAIAACTGGISLAMVFFLVSCYWGFGMASAAAWGSWAEVLVPKTVRSSYFARRTRFVQAGTLAGFVVGGFSLQYAKNCGYLLPAFAGLFAVAGICRLISAWALSAQSETAPKKDDQRSVSCLELGRRIWKGGSERFLLYLVAMQFGVYFSGPYFNPYMLRHMQLSYSTYVMLIGSCFVAKMVALPAWGLVAQRSGPQRLLWIGGLGIIPVSGLWLVSTWLPFLFFLQIIGGVAWAAYELAMLLLFFESLKREERTALMTMYNAANALSMVLGSICGGLVINYFDKSADSYLLVFALSSVLRFMTVGLLVMLPKMRVEPQAEVVPAIVPERTPVALAPVALAVERRPLPVYAEELRGRKPEPQSALAN